MERLHEMGFRDERFAAVLGRRTLDLGLPLEGRLIGQDGATGALYHCCPDHGRHVLVKRAQIILSTVTTDQPVPVIPDEDKGDMPILGWPEIHFIGFREHPQYQSLVLQAVAHPRASIRCQGFEAGIRDLPVTIAQSLLERGLFDSDEQVRWASSSAVHGRSDVRWDVERLRCLLQTRKNEAAEHAVETILKASLATQPAGAGGSD